MFLFELFNLCLNICYLKYSGHVGNKSILLRFLRINSLLSANLAILSKFFDMILSSIFLRPLSTVKI